jgi:hypothetical protein
LKKGVARAFRSIDIYQLREIPTVTSEDTDKKSLLSPEADFPSPGDTAEAEHLEKLLDEALIETFPASDPVAIAIERGRYGEDHDSL